MWLTLHFSQPVAYNKLKPVQELKTKYVKISEKITLLLHLHTAKPSSSLYCVIISPLLFYSICHYLHTQLNIWVKKLTTFLWKNFKMILFYLFPINYSIRNFLLWALLPISKWILHLLFLNRIKKSPLFKEMVVMMLPNNLTCSPHYVLLYS